MIPVGGLFETTKAYADGNAVAADMGYGTWAKYGDGRVTIADSQTHVLGETGGEETHQLKDFEMPKHVHRMAGSNWSPSSQNLQLSANQVDLASKTIDANMRLTSIHDDNLTDNYTIEPTDWASAGGDQPHNNMQPYIVVGRWVRTA